MPHPIGDNHQFRASSPRADGAGRNSQADRSQAFDNRSRQIADAARLAFVGRHQAVPFTFIPFHLIGDSV